MTAHHQTKIPMATPSANIQSFLSIYDLNGSAAPQLRLIDCEYKKVIFTQPRTLFLP
jgi:hypothetical protein